MRRCLDLFVSWAGKQTGLTFERVLSSPEIANLALRAYGLALFREGKPRYLLVYSITAIQHVRPEFRKALAGAWQIDLKWQIEEPGQCRAVLSAPVFRAILCLALLWGWHFFGGMVALGLSGMLHPNEFLVLSRWDLVFPEDALLMSQRCLYIFIKNLKTARFARCQHVRIDDPSIVALIRCFYGHFDLDTRLFPASTAVFRRQWNHLLDVLEIPRRQATRGATPGVLRGSGATREYLSDTNIATIQWRGRWARMKTLGFYIQEVAAQLFLHNLPARARNTVAILDANLACVLRDTLPERFL